MSAIAKGLDPEQAWAIFDFAYKLGISDRKWRAAVRALHANRPDECCTYGGPCIQRTECRRGGEAN